MSDVNRSLMNRRKRRPRQSIKLDRVNPRDFMRLNIQFACEHCSHYSTSQKICSMGFSPKHHTYDAQMKLYNLSGHMAYCRFLEID